MIVVNLPNSFISPKLDSESMDAELVSFVISYVKDVVTPDIDDGNELDATYAKSPLTSVYTFWTSPKIESFPYSIGVPEPELLALLIFLLKLYSTLALGLNVKLSRLTDFLSGEISITWVTPEVNVGNTTSPPVSTISILSPSFKLDLSISLFSVTDKLVPKLSIW